MQRSLLGVLNNYFQIHNFFVISTFSISRFTLNLIRLNHTNAKELLFSEIAKTTKWDTEPDDFTLVQMIRNCTNRGHVIQGKQLHSYALRSGSASNVYVCTSLVSFYSKIVSMNDAHKLFDEMPRPNIVSWNTMISGYVHSGKLWKSLSLFIELGRSELRADAYSFTSALAACGLLILLHLGVSIHSKIIVYGLASSVFVTNCLIDMYGKCSSEAAAIRVFHELTDKDVISWNSVIAACARNQRLELAYHYFIQMPCSDTITYNEMICGVSQYGEIDEAFKILKSMPKPNSSSWNAIISGYVNRNRAGEALSIFGQMYASAIKMDEFTFSSILRGIASVSALRWGTLVHSCCIKHGQLTSMIIGSALIDMYSKCGQIQDAKLVFQHMPRRNIVSWNALISGLAHNGESHRVVQYFEKLKGVKWLKPDDITFVNVLAACSLCRMPLQKAYEYIMSMVYDYGIKPKPQHVGSVFKVMGQYGQLSKAVKIIHELGFESSPPVWRALLGACGACGDLEVAKIAATKLIKLENDEAGFVILSNIHKNRGNWEDASALWEQMRLEGVMKEPGFSSIESKNQ